MTKLLHYLSWIAVFMIVFCFWAPVVNAHPLGNFTINHYAGLQVAPDGIGIDYVLDLAEIPAFQEMNHLGLDRDYKTDPGETLSYPAKKCDEVNSQLELRIDQQPLALSLSKSTVEFPPGVGGLVTLRLTCDFQGLKALSGGKNQLVEFEDKSYSRRLGWREITVVANDIPIQSNLTSSSISNRLISYPNDLLSSPLNQRQISFEINPFSEVSQQATQSSTPSSLRLDNALAGRSNDLFTNLIAQKEYNLLTIPIALAIAFLWGGLHALSPGHGKTVVGAYLVGSRSSAQHALFLGLTVTVTHTAGIFALGLLALGTSQFSLTEDLYPWLSVFSGVLVTGIGLQLLVSRLRGTEHRHTHEHEHHSHTHTHTSEVHADRDHSHLPLDANGSMTWSSLLALGVSGGLLPCPSALVVLLGAIALGRVGLGLALVSAFSLGLAAVLTGIGLLLVYAKGLFERLSIHPPRLRMLPAVSALFITLIGLGITTQTLFMYAGK